MQEPDNAAFGRIRLQAAAVGMWIGALSFGAFSRGEFGFIIWVAFMIGFTVYAGTR